jgi:hypothetical protein
MKMLCYWCNFPEAELISREREKEFMSRPFRMDTYRCRRCGRIFKRQLHDAEKPPFFGAK